MKLFIAVTMVVYMLVCWTFASEYLDEIDEIGWSGPNLAVEDFCKY
jgi:hypothetical protein